VLCFFFLAGLLLDHNIGIRIFSCGQGFQITWDESSAGEMTVSIPAMLERNRLTSYRDAFVSPVLSFRGRA